MVDHMLLVVHELRGSIFSRTCTEAVRVPTGGACSSTTRRRTGARVSVLLYVALVHWLSMLTNYNCLCHVQVELKGGRRHAGLGIQECRVHTEVDRISCGGCHHYCWTIRRGHVLGLPCLVPSAHACHLTQRTCTAGPQTLPRGSCPPTSCCGK